MSLNSLEYEMALRRASLLQSLAAPASLNGFVQPSIMAHHVQHSVAMQNLRAAPTLQSLEALQLMQLKNNQALFGANMAFSPSPALSSLNSSPTPSLYGETSSLSREPTAQPDSLPADFLLLLTKMLEDDNDDIIAWKNGMVHIYRPDLLEKQLLCKYFRTAKLTSFQRQLHYFGFRKESGFGKFAPCSYINDSTTTDIKSLLTIKRKTNKGGNASQAAMKRAKAAESLAKMNMNQTTVGAPSATNNVSPPVLPMRGPALLSAQDSLRNACASSSQRLLQLRQRAGLAPPSPSLAQLQGHLPYAISGGLFALS